MATVHKEIWTGEVLRKFRKDNSFLDVIPDRSNLSGNERPWTYHCPEHRTGTNHFPS